MSVSNISRSWLMWRRPNAGLDNSCMISGYQKHNMLSQQTSIDGLLTASGQRYCVWCKKLITLCRRRFVANSRYDEPNGCASYRSYCCRDFHEIVFTAMQWYSIVWHIRCVWEKNRTPVTFSNRSKFQQVSCLINNFRIKKWLS